MRHPYVKTAILSLSIHLLFFFAVFLTGQARPVRVPSLPIDIEIEPAKLLDTGDGKLNATPGRPLQRPGPAQKNKVRASAKQAPPRANDLAKPVGPALSPVSDTYPPAAPGDSGNASVAVPVSGGRQGSGEGPGSEGKGSPGDGQGSGGYAGAGYRSGTLPHYPSAARRAGREGVVVLRVLVAENGSAASVSVRETSGYDDFDNAAVQAVKKWRFSPARRAGQPVPSFHDVKVRFRLEGAR